MPHAAPHRVVGPCVLPPGFGVSCHTPAAAPPALPRSYTTAATVRHTPAVLRDAWQLSVWPCVSRGAQPADAWRYPAAPAQRLPTVVASRPAAPPLPLGSVRRVPTGTLLVLPGATAA